MGRPERPAAGCSSARSAPALRGRAGAQGREPAAPPPSPRVTQTLVTHSGCRRAAGAGAGDVVWGRAGPVGRGSTSFVTRLGERPAPCGAARALGRPRSRSRAEPRGAEGATGPAARGETRPSPPYLVHAHGPLRPLQRHGVGLLQPLGHGFLEPLVEAAEGQRPGPGDGGAGSGHRRGPRALLLSHARSCPAAGAAVAPR